MAAAAVFFGKLIHRYKAGPKPYAHGAVRVFNECKPYYAALQPAQIRNRFARLLRSKAELLLRVKAYIKMRHAVFGKAHFVQHE